MFTLSIRYLELLEFQLCRGAADLVREVHRLAIEIHHHLRGIADHQLERWRADRFLGAARLQRLEHQLLPVASTTDTQASASLTVSTSLPLATAAALACGLAAGDTDWTGALAALTIFTACGAEAGTATGATTGVDAGASIANIGAEDSPDGAEASSLANGTEDSPPACRLSLS